VTVTLGWSAPKASLKVSTKNRRNGGQRMNYPKNIKAFYMRVNDDGRTVAAMDVLARYARTAKAKRAA
jgi:hypothetical protein